MITRNRGGKLLSRPYCPSQEKQQHNLNLFRAIKRQQQRRNMRNHMNDVRGQQDEGAE